MDCRDDWLCRVFNLVDHFCQPRRLQWFSKLTNVSSSDEGPTFAMNHQCGNPGIVIAFGYGSEQTSAHGLAQGVNGRIVNADDADFAVLKKSYWLTHASGKSSSMSSASARSQMRALHKPPGSAGISAGVSPVCRMAGRDAGAPRAANWQPGQPLSWLERLANSLHFRQAGFGNFQGILIPIRSIEYFQ